MLPTRYFPLFCFSLMMLASCRKQTLESFQSAEDNAQLETEFAQVYEAVADFAASDARTAKTEDYLLPNGALVSFTDSVFSDGDGIDFEIDYGPLGNTNPKGRLCKDGRYRAGKVHVGMNKRWSEIPCRVTVAITSSDEYYAGNGTNMYKITGTKIINRISSDVYEVEVTNATLQRTNGTVYWNSERTVTKIFDDGAGWLNDEFSITGNASGSNANGDSFTVQITSPLLKKLSVGCMSTFIAGELMVTNSNGKELEINYDSFGSQACDKTITVSYNGRSRNITLW